MTCATCNNWPDRIIDVPVGEHVEIQTHRGAWLVERRPQVCTTVLHERTGQRRTLYPGERVRRIG